MKIIINESKLDQIVTKFFIERLGEFVDQTNQDPDGVFFKEDEITGATYRRDLYVKSELIITIRDMFGYPGDKLEKLIIRVVSDLLGGRRLDYLFLMG
jgi:hypothetical protein